ncbi:MAG: NAD(P)H-dependent oxidoreductase subunit E, partial [Chloroflexota bacterium]
MDLHVIGPLASPAERAAVDAVLGPPESGWVGGPRDSGTDGHSARGGHATRSRRSQLLPALHAVQSRIGWISTPALNYICKRLAVAPAEAYGVATFYALFATSPRAPIVAHVCDDIACRLAGAEELCGDLARAVGPAGEPVRDGRATWLRSPCLGLCDRAPAVLFTFAGESPAAFAHAPVDAVGVAAMLEADHAPGRYTFRDPAPPDHVPTPLLGRVGVVDPASLDDYRAHGGYVALTRALEIGPDAVIAEVTASKLMGRGGAAFPTGRKWAAVAAQPAQPHYLVCNADESEPGTFKDRVLLEGDPFATVEAMTIAAFATGASQGYLYIRGEYPEAEASITGAIGAARQAGLLGADIAGSGFDFDIDLRRGAGAYICGEETALFESIEGKRGEPRNKPPFPVERGLFGKPTVVNNVETLANIPLIVLKGGEAFARIGTDGSTGPKLFCLSGHVARPGTYEVEFGATLRDLIDLAGGVPGGRAIKTILLGGAAGVFVGPEALDMPLTFEATRAAGATLGSGVIMVFDETADLVDLCLRIARFFRDESCGQCVPCRVGTVRQEEALHRLVAGRTIGSPGDE